MFAKIQIKKIIVTIFLFYSLISISDCFAETQTSSSKNLRKLSTKITRLKKSLHLDKSKQSNLQKKLHQSEKMISDNNNKLDNITQQIKQQTTILATLKSQVESTKKRLEKQQLILVDQLKGAYINSRQNSFISLLNQRDPADIGRYLVLYQHFNEQHLQYIHSLKNDLDNLERDTQAIKATQKKLAVSRAQQIQVKTKLEQQSAKRKQLLTQIKQHIHQQNTQLSILHKEKKVLEQVLDKIQKEQQAKRTSLSSTSLKNYENKLAWPLIGNIRHHFGEKIKRSDLSWNGILIAAKEGQAVHAVYPGKVVFADWLQGFGFTIIIDHDGKFMSLYAHNRSLQKNLQQEVKIKETIAIAGNSGGFSESGLYFELRHNGKPINPENWLKKN